jgi:hypothetical protein
LAENRSPKGDPKGNDLERPNSDSAIARAIEEGYQAEVKRLVLEEQQRWDKVKEHAKDPGSLLWYSTAEILKQPGGCLFAPIYLTLYFVSFYYSQKAASILLGEFNCLWLVIFVAIHSVSFLALYFPLTWLHEKLFVDKDKE